MEESAQIVRETFAAFLRGDIETIRKYVDANLEWTYLDPSLDDPAPATCHGREQLEKAVGTWASLGLRAELEELLDNQDRVMVILHAPGLDQFRARKAHDRNFHVATLRDGRIQAIRACRNRDEALAATGLDQAV